MDERSFFQHQVPERFKNASLSSCLLIPPQYVTFAEKWAEKPTSLFLFGGYGTGKTYFAFSAIREIFRKCPKRLWPRYFTSPQLDARLLKASKSDEGDEYELKNLSEQDILFLDDIGRETKSERIKRQYFEIINERYNRNLCTILTSNLSLDKLGDVLDGAIASRIQEWTTFEFKGPDLRKNL